MVKVVYRLFKANDNALFRIHIDPENLLQMIYQTIAAYFEDDCADELTIDPVFTAIPEKEALASQPTISRFYNRMDETTLRQFDQIEQCLRDIVYSIKRPERITAAMVPEHLRFRSCRSSGRNIHPCRVVFKIEKPENQMTFMYTFVVTTMESEPWQVIQFYCGRGKSRPFSTIYDFQAVQQLPL